MCMIGLTFLLCVPGCLPCLFGRSRGIQKCWRRMGTRTTAWVSHTQRHAQSTLRTAIRHSRLQERHLLRGGESNLWHLARWLVSLLVETVMAQGGVCTQHRSLFTKHN
jgi:hypothetical protein